MKSYLLLLIFSLGLYSLWGQNPITHQTQYFYDFGTDSYVLSNEQSYEYNEAEQLIFQRYATWQEDRSFPNITYQTAYTYHENGSVAIRDARSYRIDTLRNGYWSQYDLQGKITQDSSFYLNDEGETEYYGTRFTYTYDAQGRLKEEQIEGNNYEAPAWTINTYRLYTYNANGCLTELATGNSRSDPTFRTRNEYDEDCRLTATYDENRNGFSPWVAFRRVLYTYEETTDSLVVKSQSESWRADLNQWTLDNLERQVYDLQDNLLHRITTYPNGAAGESVYRYDDEGNRSYYREGYRELQTSQWMYWVESFTFENSATRHVNLRRNDWDTTRQQYRLSSRWEQDFGENGRLLAQNYKDTLWNGTSFDFRDGQITYQFDEYCDGEVKTRFRREGSSGLAPQPTGKIEYGYLKAADCTTIADNFSLQVNPNPSNHVIMIESELLVEPQVSIRLIDTRGSVIKTYPNTGRQGRLTLDIRDLKAGMYILQLNHPEHQISQQIFKQ
ncbi:MAG: T9SS type A sorting domain-containing protein [Bacteroidota bacterium]